MLRSTRRDCNSLPIFPLQNADIGCGYGTSIKQVLETIEKALGISMNVSYIEGRNCKIGSNKARCSQKQYFHTHAPLLAFNLQIYLHISKDGINSLNPHVFITQ